MKDYYYEQKIWKLNDCEVFLEKKQKKLKN